MKKRGRDMGRFRTVIEALCSRQSLPLNSAIMS